MQVELTTGTARVLVITVTQLLSRAGAVHAHTLFESYSSASLTADIDETHSLALVSNYFLEI